VAGAESGCTGCDEQVHDARPWRSAGSRYGGTEAPVAPSRCCANGKGFEGPLDDAEPSQPLGADVIVRPTNTPKCSSASEAVLR
jgi:hypothetical protein